MSKVSAVRLSGLELVPRAKLKGKLATARDVAKLNWKPWKRSPDMSSTEFVPSREITDALGITARIAYGIMLKSRADLIEMQKTIEHETVDELMGNLAQASEDLKALASMVDQAYVRILASASRHAVNGGKFKFRGGSSRRAKPSEI
jgi:hypothetical protein